mmetsp:Transcript_27/g.77  ORF Transcript_27/g.77 Transcript_27/m.77 type:complete len:242 (+) Transcript_27:42-767(+)
MEQLDKTVKFMKRTDGRDKSFRVLQYSSMLLVALLREDTKLSDVIGSLRRAMSTTRKALRLVRMLENVQTVRQVLYWWKSEAENRISRIFDVLAAVSEVFYFYYDHLVWLHRVNLRVVGEKEYNRVDLMSSYTWLLNAVFDFASATTKLVRISRTVPARLAPAESSESAKRRLFETKREKALAMRKQGLAVAKLGSDVITAACEARLFWFLNSRQNQIVEGLSGLAASIIGFHSVWQDTKV